MVAQKLLILEVAAASQNVVESCGILHLVNVDLVAIWLPSLGAKTEDSLVSYAEVFHGKD